MENTDITEQALRELRIIRKLLQEHLVPEKPKEIEQPKLVDITWALRELGIGRSTFYKHVRGKLLPSVLRIGSRDYYERETVRNLHLLHREGHLPYRKLVPIEPETASPKAA